ncbi:MAG TPA: hypothetical protein VF811_14560 [Parasulfuritortus sp.]
MNMLMRNFLILLFALLQGFAPLLHAHSGFVLGHGGIHLPDLDGNVVHHGPPVLEEVHHHATIGVADSLESRRGDVPFPPSPVLAGRLPGLDIDQALPWVPVPVLKSVYSRADYLRPYPCAPPRV